MTEHFEKTITILGDGGIGKTSLVYALKTNKTLSPENIQKTAFLEIEDLLFEEFKIICYDLPGQDSITHPINVLPDTIFKDTNLILLAFSLDRFNSLMNLETWLLQVRNYYKNKALSIPVVILLGTKADLKKRIDEKLIENIILNVPEIVDYVKVSAITQEGLDILRSKILYHLGLNLSLKGAPMDEISKLRQNQVKSPLTASIPLEPSPVSEVVTSLVEQDVPILDANTYESSKQISLSKPEITNTKQTSDENLHQEEQTTVMEPVAKIPEEIVNKAITTPIPDHQSPLLVNESVDNSNTTVLTLDSSGEDTISVVDDIKNNHPVSSEKTIKEEEQAVLKQNIELNKKTPTINESKKHTDLKLVSKEFFLVWNDSGFKYVTEKPANTEITIVFQVTQSKIKLLFPSNISRVTKLIVQRQIDSITRFGYLLPDGSRIGRGFIVE